MNTLKRCKNSKGKMVYKISALLLVVALLVSSMPTSMMEVSAETSGNWSDEGKYDTAWFDQYTMTYSETNQFEISSAAELAAFAKLVNEGKNFEDKTVTLRVNIDLSGYEWTAIGTDSKSFKGTFNGNNRTITGLTITSASTSTYNGLFGYVEDATIMDVGVGSDINISSDSTVYVGGVVALASESKVTNCYNTGTVSGSCSASYLYVGGVVGYAYNSSVITNCYNTGEVSGSASSSSVYVGGVVARVSISKITDCYNTGAVSGSGDGVYVGGVAGNNVSENSIENCYNTGAVSGSGSYLNVGGIVGINDKYSPTTNCYNTGAVSASGNTSRTVSVGGIVGNNSASIENCYNIGAVSGSNSSTGSVYVGGVVGVNDSSTITNCYYNTETITYTETLSDASYDGVTGLTIEEMTGTTSDSDYAMTGISGDTWTFTADDVVTTDTTKTTTYTYPVLISNTQDPAPTSVVVVISAETPAFDADLANATYEYSDTVTALDATAIVEDGGTISYKWYSSSDEKTWTEIENATAATYTPSSETIGTVYYKVEATNTLTDSADGSTKTATETSNTATITVERKKVTVEIADQEIVRGEDIPTLTGTSSDENVVPKYTVTADNMTVGNYEITMSNADDYETYYNITVTTGKLTVTDGYEVIINGETITDVAYGDTIDEPETPTKDGYYFLGWEVDGEMWDFETDVVTGDIEFTPVFAKKETYDIDSVEVDYGENNSAQFTIEAEYNEFLALYFDGNKVLESDYSVEEGSTIITLTEEYVSTFNPGEYELTADFEKGTATLILVVNEVTTENDTEEDTLNDGDVDVEDDTSSEDDTETEDTETDDTTTPETGDTSAIFAFAILALVAGCGVVILGRRRRVM